MQLVDVFPIEVDLTLPEISKRDMDDEEDNENTVQSEIDDNYPSKVNEELEEDEGEKLLKDLKLLNLDD